MKLSQFSRPQESLYEAIERAMKLSHAVIGEAGDEPDSRPFATINAALDHANTYGVDTLTVRRRR